MMAAPQFSGPKTVLSSGQIAGLLAIDAAKRGGFPQLEAAHVALLRADIARNPLSDVRPAVPTASQVATPCVEGLMPTDGAVTANASEVLVADVGPILLGGRSRPDSVVSDSALGFNGAESDKREPREGAISP
jgi:hypothetical protein